MKKLRTSTKDSVLFGVCGGLGERFGVEPWIFRIAFLLIGPLWFPYLVLALCLD
jgi:phage shock protein C